MKAPSRLRPCQGESGSRYLLLLILYALGVAIYFVGRFGGNWLDGDTTGLTRVAERTLDQATLVPSTPYQYGFCYPVLAAWIAHLTGLSMQPLQTVVLPVAGAVAPAVVALVLFRALLGKWMPAVLAALMLYLQPDFLFITLRGSHEKLTWPLAMLVLFILYRSAAWPGGLRRFAIHVGLFYLTVFALIATNFFFASTLITAITLSLLLGLFLSWWQVRRRRCPPPPGFQRLALVSVASTVIVYLFIFYIYPPARLVFWYLRQTLDKVAVLALGFEPQAMPYEYISLSWISPRVYFALTLFTWTLLLGSLAEWVYQGFRLLRGVPLRLPEALPWLLYAGFAGQVAVAIVVDFAGALSANLQLRVLPSLVILAVVLAAQGLHRLLSRLRSGGLSQRFLFAGLALLAAWFVLASLLKSTNDPAVSNKWSFYGAAEKSALGWANTRLRYARIWIGLDERLWAMAAVFYPESYRGAKYEVYAPGPTTRYFLLSETERLRHARVGKVLPALTYENQVYDNGETQLYHKRPQTPYQR